MTEPGDPLTGWHGNNGRASRRRRNKLPPDPDVRRTILAAAAKSVREHGVRGLSIATVLSQAQLSTRAFYRHFESKDQLVAAVFLEMTREEVRQLRTMMAAAATPIQAVAAWIDGRLDPAFADDIKSELRAAALAGESQICLFPDMVSSAYHAILDPLIEQLELGLELGVFEDIVPATAAKSIHGVVWAGTQRQSPINHWDPDDVRERTVRFCLRGLGVAPDTIDEITAVNAPVAYARPD